MSSVTKQNARQPNYNKLLFPHVLVVLQQAHLSRQAGYCQLVTCTCKTRRRSARQNLLRSFTSCSLAFWNAKTINWHHFTACCQLRPCLVYIANGASIIERQYLIVRTTIDDQHQPRAYDRQFKWQKLAKLIAVNSIAAKAGLLVNDFLIERSNQERSNRETERKSNRKAGTLFAAGIANSLLDMVRFKSLTISLKFGEHYWA